MVEGNRSKRSGVRAYKKRRNSHNGRWFKALAVVLFLGYTFLVLPDPWFRKYFYFRPLHLFLGVWIFLALYFMTFPFPYFKYVLSKTFFFLKVIPFFRKALTLSRKEKLILRKTYWFSLTRDGKLKTNTVGLWSPWDDVIIFSILVFLQTLVWVRALLYHVFGWKIHLFLDSSPVFVPWIE